MGGGNNIYPCARILVPQEMAWKQEQEKGKRCTDGTRKGIRVIFKPLRLGQVGSSRAAGKHNDSYCGSGVGRSLLMHGNMREGECMEEGRL